MSLCSRLGISRVPSAIKNVPSLAATYRIQWEECVGNASSNRSCSASRCNCWRCASANFSPVCISGIMTHLLPMHLHEMLSTLSSTCVNYCYKSTWHETKPHRHNRLIFKHHV